MALLETRFYSTTLGLSLGANIILPGHPEAWREPPAVLYLLHGLSDDHTAWCRRTSIERYAFDYNLAIVMPDAYKSFCCDMAHGSDYWSFVADELPKLVKQWFNVSNDWRKTFVAGLSMGGYGAFKLAMGLPGRFAAAASLSGALDLGAHIGDDFSQTRLRCFEAVFGDIATLPGSRNDLIAQLKAMETVPETRFYIVCGTEDYLYKDSLAFRDLATKKGLDLTYEEAAGEHEWGFWDTYIQRVLEWLPIEKLARPEA
jgi:putative tributyrin esterase